MADLMNQMYSFDEDGILRLQKDLNYMFYHLDDKNVRRLYTEYCEIKSKEGETEIDGPLIVMKGDPGTTNSTTIRIKMGWNKDSSNFEFNIYGSSGAPSIEINSSGEVVVRGNINTEKDIYVGNRIFLGWGGSTVLPTAVLAERGMYIMQPNTTQYMSAIYSTEVNGTTVIVDQYYEFEIETSNSFNITAADNLLMYMYAGYATSNGPNSSGEIEILAFNGRLFLNGGLEKYNYQTGVFLADPWARTRGEIYIGDGSWETRILASGEMEYDLEQDIRYMYAHNTKFIARPTTDWVERTSDYLLAGSTRVITSTRGCYINSESSDNTYMEARSTISSLDLTQFYDGSALTSNDYIVAAIWYPSTSSITSAFIKLGHSSDNFYYTNFSTAFDYGWNIQARKLGWFNTAGTPNWNNISWVSIGFDLSTQGPRVGISAYFDYIGAIRSYSQYPYFSAFQREINSTHEQVFRVSTDTYALIYKHENTPCIMDTGIKTATPVGLRLRYLSAFDAKIKAYSHKGNEAPSLTFAYSYGSTTNGAFSITAQLSSGVFRLHGHRAGTTFGDYLSGLSFDAFTNVEVGLKRRTEFSSNHSFSSEAINDKYVGWFMISSNPDSYREISFEAVATTILDPNYLYIGTPSVDSGAKITSVVIKPYNDYTGGYDIW